MSDVPFDQKPPEERHRIVDEAIRLVESGYKSEWMIKMEQEWAEFRERLERECAEEMERLRTSSDPEERLQWVLSERARKCGHSQVPFVKSYYSDETVQRGVCPECGTHLLELD